MYLSRKTWGLIAAALIVLALLWVACGFSVYFVPEGPLLSLTEFDTMGFQITRACCVGPALAMVFLAYVLFRTGHRASTEGREMALLHWSVLVSALGIAIGLILALMGLAVWLAPAPGDTADTRMAFIVFFTLPGLFLIIISGMFWVFYARKQRE